MASLLTIPLELLVAISSLVSTRDLGALRLTCKQVEKSLYEWFSKEFFTKKQFMLTHESLQAFIDISKHASFSQKLTHVIIATNNYVDEPMRFRDEDASARYIQGYEDQAILMTTGIDRDMLTEAFMRLSNLQTVGIRDFNNHKRSRDGINWTSWGAPTIEQETGQATRFSGNSRYTSAVAFLAHVFQVIIVALGKANQKPEEIEVLLRRNWLSEYSFRIPDFIYPTIKPCLLGLKKLLLRVDLSPGHLHSRPDGTLLDRVSGRTLRRFLRYTPNLTHLRLNLPQMDVDRNAEFLQWLATPTASQDPLLADKPLDPPPVDLVFLERLDFGQFRIQPSTILSVVAKFAPTLQSLNLWQLSIFDVQMRTHHDRGSNMWQPFFKSLGKIPQLQLNHLMVGKLTQHPYGVQFKTPDNKKVDVKEYSGNKMGAFLEELCEEAVVMWPEVVEVVEESQSDEDEYGDEDGEEDEGEDEDEEMEDGSEDDDGNANGNVN
jgi:hypothetical protein